MIDMKAETGHLFDLITIIVFLVVSIKTFIYHVIFIFMTFKAMWPFLCILQCNLTKELIIEIELTGTWMIQWFGSIWCINIISGGICLQSSMFDSWQSWGYGMLHNLVRPLFLGQLKGMNVDVGVSMQTFEWKPDRRWEMFVMKAIK